MATALQERGVPPLRAILAARTGMAAFAEATIAWLEDDRLDLAGQFDLVKREWNAGHGTYDPPASPS